MRSQLVLLAAFPALQASHPKVDDAPGEVQRVTLQDMRKAVHQIEKVFEGIAHTACGVVSQLDELRWKPFTGGPLPCNKLMATDCDISYHQMECPEECPFMAPDRHFPCQFSCREAANCSSSNVDAPFPDPTYNLCTSCSVSACAWCDTQKSCKQCHDGFTLSEDGKCAFGRTEGVDSMGDLVFNILLKVVAVVVVFILISAGIYQCFRSKNEFAEHNAASLTLGLRNRHLTKVHEWDIMSEKRTRRRYPLFVELSKYNILGVGFGLFYNSIVFVLVVALLTCAATWYVANRMHLQFFFSGESTARATLIKVLQQTEMPKSTIPAVIVSPMMSCRENRPEDLAQHLKDFAFTRSCTFGILYLLLLAVSIVYLKMQKVWARKFDEHSNSMCDFVVLLTGFPPDATNEVELKQWAQDALTKCGLGHCEVEGASIGYDYSGQVEQVNDMVQRFCKSLEIQRRRDAGTAVFLQEDLELVGLEAKRLEDRKQVSQWFSSGTAMKSTGQVFLVFKFNTFKDSVMSKYKTNKKIFEYRGKVIEASVVKSEPPDVFWQNLQVPDDTIVKNERRALLQVVIFLCLLNVLLYLWNREVTLPYLAAGSKASMMITMLQGSIVGIMNGVMNSRAKAAAYSVGFHRKDQADVSLFLTNFVITFCNTLFNLGLMCYSVMIADKEKFLKGPNYLDELSSASPVGEESDLAYNVYLMLIPGQFFVNSLNGLTGPLVQYVQTVLLAKVIYVWKCFPPLLLQLVKAGLPGAPTSLDQYGVIDAEEGLKVQEINLPADYSNLVVNPFLVFLSFFMVSTTSHKLSMFLALWAVFIYVWHRFMHLRVQSASFYSTEKLNWVVKLSWGAPLSTLASCAFAWGIRSGKIMPSSPVSHRWLALLAVYVVAILVWIAAMLFMDPPHKENVSDDKVCSFNTCKAHWIFSWFNCNPVFTLKCLYHVDTLDSWNHPLASGEDPKVVRFYRPGKEYLHVAPSKMKSILGGDLYDSLEFETWFEALAGCFSLMQKRHKVDPGFIAEELQQLRATPSQV